MCDWIAEKRLRDLLAAAESVHPLCILCSASVRTNRSHSLQTTGGLQPYFSPIIGTRRKWQEAVFSSVPDAAAAALDRIDASRKLLTSHKIRPL